MQPVTAPPRDALTAAQVTGLIEDAPALIVGFGVELIDASLSVLEDISADVSAGTVERHYFNTLHGGASLSIRRDLDWGQARVRPYQTLSDGVTTARFNLGAYFTSTPARPTGSLPTFTVQCYDVLSALASRVGGSYAVDAGTSYLTAVEQILLAQGVSAYTIDQGASGTVLPTPRAWVLDNDVTWLTICNQLLSSIGYQGIYSDWDGRLRVEPYLAPADRAPEWYYINDPYVAIHSPNGEVQHDYWDAPNRWVFYRSNNVDADPPVDGDGRYEFENESVGETSQQARGGRVITRVEGLDVADHASLVAAAQSLIDADMQVGTTITTTTSPNPLCWHRDRLFLSDPDYGPDMNLVSSDWTLDLTGGDMQHAWKVLQV